MPRILVVHEFAQPPERVFAYVAEHEHMEQVLGLRVRRLSEGDDGTRNGPGSSRRMSLGPLLPFVETTTAVDEPRRIEYRITQGTPLRGHRGAIRLGPLDDGGTHLEWEIVFDGTSPPGLSGLLRRGLELVLRRGMGQIAKRA